MLFENVQKGDVNKRSERHRTMVKALLQGTTKVRAVDVTVAMYKRTDECSNKAKFDSKLSAPLIEQVAFLDRFID
jgi:hypothetical protein